MVHFVLTCICYGMLGVCISLERKSWLKLRTGWYRSDLVSYSIPRNTAGPDHSSIAEVHSLGSCEHAGQAEAALVLGSRVPTEVRNHWHDNILTFSPLRQSNQCVLTRNEYKTISVWFHWNIIILGWETQIWSDITLSKSWYLSESTLL